MKCMQNKQEATDIDFFKLDILLINLIMVAWIWWKD